MLTSRHCIKPMSKVLSLLQPQTATNGVGSHSPGTFTKKMSELELRQSDKYMCDFSGAPIAGVRADYDGGGGTRPKHRRVK